MTRITPDELLTAFNYKDDDLLMNSETGSVDTARNWAEDSVDWADGTDSEDQPSIEEQFSTLVEVKKDVNGDWVEVQ